MSSLGFKLGSPEEYGFEQYKEYRPNQRKAIESIMNAIEKGKRYIIAELPTGTGKSLIAMTVSHIISQKTYIVVSTKTLQNQYMREFKIPTVIGRSNFRCLVRPKLTVDKAPCNVRKCGFISECPYFVQRDKAVNSIVSIHNYAYYLTSMNYTNLWDKADLVVFDEAHTMDSHLTNFVSMKIPKEYLDLGSDVVHSLEIAYEDISNKIDDIKDIIDEYGEESKTYQILVDEINELVKYQRKLMIVIDNYDEKNWVIDETPKSYSFRPVWSSQFSNLYFEHGKIFLMMSATIGNINIFTKLLNIPDKEAIFIRSSTMFDVENRPINIISGPSINYSNLDKILPDIVDKIDIIIKNESGKGIIHVPSYYVANYIKNYSRYKNIMLSHDTKNREMIIDEFMKSDDKILVSPSVHTGLDFKGDLARWQIITKVPYADLRDKIVKRRFELNKKWYTQDAIIKVVQSYGRIVRSYDDWGNTYILDGNIYYLINRYSDMFPSWFLEAFKFCKISKGKIVCRGD